MNTCKTKRYSVDQPPSWWPAVCSTTSTTARSLQPAACSSKPSQKPPPSQPAPSRPAWLLYHQSCLPCSSHLQSALFEALLAVPNSFHPPGGQRCALSPLPSHILSPLPYHPLWPHWLKSCSLASEGRKCSQCSLCPGPADAVTQDLTKA